MLVERWKEKRRGRREGKEKRDGKCWKTGKAHEATKICVRCEIDRMTGRRGRWIYIFGPATLEYVGV